MACISIMVGKKAAMDGVNYIARNEDNFVANWPKRFFVQQSVSRRNETYTSPYNKLSVKLPESGYRYTSSPNASQDEGWYEEDGINEKNVGMSATESVVANEKVLAYDPLIEDGVAEDSIVTLVLPYIDSARGGVEFFDEDEIWYMELATGHHWVATRIPDDCYAVAANQMAFKSLLKNII